MYARIATFEGATAIDETAQQIEESDRPEGLPSAEFYFLTDRAAGKVVTIAFFESEADLQKGNEILNGINPPGSGLGTRSSVDLLEVAAHMKV